MVEVELSALIPPPLNPPMLFEHAETTSAALNSTTKVMPEVIKDEQRFNYLAPQILPLDSS